MFRTRSLEGATYINNETQATSRIAFEVTISMTMIQISGKETIDSKEAHETWASVWNDDPYSVPHYARYLGRTESSLQEQIFSIIVKLKECKNSLAVDARDRLKIFTHSELITSSCFVIDADEKRPRILIDHKLYSGQRATSYGIELSSPAHPLFESVNTCFSALRKRAKELV